MQFVIYVHPASLNMHPSFGLFFTLSDTPKVESRILASSPKFVARIQMAGGEKGSRFHQLKSLRRPWKPEAISRKVKSDVHTVTS